MIGAAAKLLINAQRPDGGWGALPDKSSNTECTSLSVLALDTLKNDHSIGNIKGGLDWLIQRQHENGSWPLSDSSTDASWTTALAIIALSRFLRYQEQMVRAARWLLNQEGRTPGLLARVISALSSRRTTVVDLDPGLIGWSWVPRTFSWVEPTSYALIALKKVRSSLPGTNIEERLHQGELMIYDRMCAGGGWNYGNSKVFGETLWPYPDVTAVALIALQDRRATQGNQESLRALRKMMQETDSGLALSWGSICLSVYGQDTLEWKRQIERRFELTGFLGETKTIALALIASVNEAMAFRI